jgi:cell division protein ZapA
MTDNTPVTVHILDKEYRVACPEHEQEALRNSASYLDAKMREIREAGKIVGADRIAVMAALNIVNELLQQQDRRRASAQNMSARIRSLEDRISVALSDSR